MGVDLVGHLAIRLQGTEPVQEAAEQLRRLQENNPDGIEGRRLEVALRLATKDRFQMLAVRRLRESGENAQAIAGLLKLFPDGPPSGELGIEYYRVIAGGPNGERRARVGLERLMAENPGDPRYPLALAAHLLDNPRTRQQGFQLYAKTSRDFDLHQPGILTPWRNALRDLPNFARHGVLYRDYLAAVPDDPEVQALLDRSQQPAVLALETAMKDIARNQLGAAERNLGRAVSTRPDDPEVLRGLALLRARQGRVRESDEFYARAREREALPTVRARAMTDQAELDMAAGRTGAAITQLEMARSLDPENVWARLDLARLYAKTGRADKGRKLMADAVAKDSPSPDGLYAQAIYLNSLNDPAGALRAIYRVSPRSRSNKMIALAEGAHADIRRRLIANRCTQRRRRNYLAFGA